MTKRVHLRLTPEQIEAGKSAAGGFTKRQLAKWGVPYPPVRGWKWALLNGRPIPKRPKRGSSSKRQEEWEVDQAHRALDRQAGRGL